MVKWVQGRWKLNQSKFSACAKCKRDDVTKGRAVEIMLACTKCETTRTRTRTTTTTTTTTTKDGVRSQPIGESGIYHAFMSATNRRFTRRVDRRLPPGCYGNLIVNVKRGQSRPKRACGVDPGRHDWATFTMIAEVCSCCTKMTKES